MASIKNLYEQQLSEIFAFGQLTDPSPISRREPDLSTEMMALEWLLSTKMMALEWSRQLDAEEIEKKIKREDLTMEIREAEAENSTNISRENAKKDLFLNQKSPFLFRRYMMNYWNRRTSEWQESYPTLSDHHKRMVRIECGLEVNRIIHPCGGSRFGEAAEFDPTKKWVFDIPYEERTANPHGYSPEGNNLMLRYGMGCCGANAWSHQGNCWDGSWYTTRPVPDPKPFKVN